MLSKGRKVMARSPDDNRNFFNIVAGVLQGDTFGTMNVNWFNERK